MYSKRERVGGCLFMLALVALQGAIGGVAVNYLIAVFFSRNIPFWADVLIGLVTAEITAPLALVVWILRMFGVV